MAILTITEFSHMPSDARSSATMCGHMPSVAEQQVSISGGSLASAPFDPATRFIRINCDMPCCIAGSPGLGQTPVAVLGFHRLGANETAYYGVNPGDMLAVIAST